MWLGFFHSLSDFIPQKHIRFPLTLVFYSPAAVNETESTGRLEAPLIAVWFTVGLFAYVDLL